MAIEANPAISYTKTSTNGNNTIYEVKGDNKVTQYTVPLGNEDKFEKSLNALNTEIKDLDELKKINPESMKFKMITNTIIGTFWGSIIGTGLGALITKKSSTAVKIFGNIGMNILGMGIGAAAGLGLATHKTIKPMKKLAVSIEELNSSGAKPIEDSPAAAPSEKETVKPGKNEENK